MIIDNKFYKGDLKARMFHPDTTNSNGKTLIHVHGGAFASGSIDLISHWCEYLAKNGWEVVAFTYRSNETSTIEDAIQDIGDALIWWSSLNPKKQAYLCGNSAGAYLVAYQCIFDRVPFQVPGCIMFCPVTDIRTKNRKLNYCNKKTKGYTRKEREALSLINHVDKKIDTRFLITHGRNDVTVPFRNSVAFHKRLGIHNNSLFLPHDGGHPHWKQPENLPESYKKIMKMIDGENKNGPCQRDV